MEDGLKQRIYENILRFLENYRYIKSTAEATIPNFIFQNSPLLSLFYVVRFWGCPLIFDGKSTLLPMDGGPNQTNQSPVRSLVSTAEHIAGGCGVLLLGFGQRLAVFSRRSPSLV